MIDTDQLIELVIRKALAGMGQDELVNFLRWRGFDLSSNQCGIERLIKKAVSQLAGNGRGMSATDLSPIRNSTPSLRSFAKNRWRLCMKFERPEIMLFKDLVSESEASQLIAISRPRLEKSLVLNEANKRREVSSHRNSNSMFFRRRENDLVSTIESRIFEIFDWPEAFTEGLQVVRYMVGEQYKPHYDYFSDINSASVTGRSSNQRVATLIIFANTPRSGGRTVFPDAQVEFYASTGNAVYFSYGDPSPSSLTLHGGSEVFEGEKWIFTKWFRSGSVF